MSDPRQGPSTKDLVEAWRAGDSQAGELLFERQLPNLLSAVRARGLGRRLGPCQDTTDMVQEAFVRLVSSGLCERFENRGPGSLHATLLGVVDHTILDALRAQGTLKRALDDGGADADMRVPAENLFDSREPSPTSEARMEEWVSRCRAVLSEREWKVWHAVEVCRQSRQEVANELGVSASAVRGCYYRARRRVLASLREDP